MFGSKRRAEKKAAEAAAKQAHDDAVLRQTVVNLIAIAQGQDSTDPEWPLVLKSGERLVSTIQGCGLFEPRRGPGHFEGRSAGVSVPVGNTGLRVRVGKSAGTFVQGAEAPAVIDTGNASITTQRIVFQGDKYTREWDFSKLIGVVHYSDRPATAIQVSNRQKTSGIVVAGPSPESWRLAITVAVAIFHGEADETITELQDELAKLDAATPRGSRTSPDAGPVPPETEDGGRGPTPGAASAPVVPPAVGQAAPPASTLPLPSALPPPEWAADPTGRHQLRYWDGKTWTDYVADNGQESRDPVPGPL